MTPTDLRQRAIHATEQFLAGRITESAMREQVAATLQEIK